MYIRSMMKYKKHRLINCLVRLSKYSCTCTVHVCYNCQVVGVYSIYNIVTGLILFVSHLYFYIETTIQDAKPAANYSLTQISEYNGDQQKGITTHCH